MIKFLKSFCEVVLKIIFSRNIERVKHNLKRLNSYKLEKYVMAYQLNG